MAALALRNRDSCPAQSQAFALDELNLLVTRREAALLASLTIRGSVFGVDISVPLLEVHDDAAGPTAASGPALEDQSKKAAPAPTAEVLELQRRLAASGDHNVVAQMLSNPAQLDPLDVRSIARWLKAKGRDLDIAEEQIHLHAHWRQVFMPAGHIPEVCSSDKVYSLKTFHVYSTKLSALRSTMRLWCKIRSFIVPAQLELLASCSTLEQPMECLPLAAGSGGE